MRKNGILALFMLTLGLAACDSESSDKPRQDASHHDKTSACVQLLGAEGVKWAKGSTDKETGLSETADMASARKHFFDDARAWDPESNKVPYFTGAEVCNVGMLHAKSGTGYLSIRYGASIFPFDDVHDEVKTVTGGSVSVVPVNSDVKLAVRKDRHGEVEYSVYVKCRVPKSPDGQESEVPLEGTMTDTLTGDASKRVHLQRMLYSARVVAREFGCQNNPTVPMTLPAD